MDPGNEVGTLGRVGFLLLVRFLFLQQVIDLLGQIQQSIRIGFAGGLETKGSNFFTEIHVGHPD